MTEEVEDEEVEVVEEEQEVPAEAAEHTTDRLCAGEASPLLVSTRVLSAAFTSSAEAPEVLGGAGGAGLASVAAAGLLSCCDWSGEAVTGGAAGAAATLTAAAGSELLLCVTAPLAELRAAAV